MSTTIRDFWLTHPTYWISTGENQKVADKVIYDTFYNYDFTHDDDFGKVIYLDQFMRHFSRVIDISEATIQNLRISAVELVKTVDILKCTEAELVWYLMPFKHLCDWTFLFQTIQDWLNGRAVVDYLLLNRYFMDSYKKAYTDKTIADKIQLMPGCCETYDRSVCESHPDPYLNADFSEAKKLIKALDVCTTPVIISLSGGVDSMLMTALIAKAKKVDLIAVHIVYGNRSESVDELKFIQTYCYHLGIQLYVYHIEWLRRNSVDRAFYEKMTRDIRFTVYRALKRPVLLGHIQDDVIENIWTNLAKGTNLDDLAKISIVSTELDVLIYRPWLTIKKTEIHKVASSMNIPFLKNTTPSWSNRGKFREHFYVASHNQYGVGVDAKLLEVAGRYKKQSELLDKLLFCEILKSWVDSERTINITKTVNVDLDGDCWLRIFTDLAHRILKVGKPSFAACNDFSQRIKRLVNGQSVSLSKDFTVTYIASDDCYDSVYLKIH